MAEMITTATNETRLTIGTTVFWQTAGWWYAIPVSQADAPIDRWQRVHPLELPLLAHAAELQRERDAARNDLAEAAREINCAGPVAHRIRVLKGEWSERLAEAEDDAARWRALRGRIPAREPVSFGEEFGRYTFTLRGQTTFPEWVDQLVTLERHAVAEERSP